MNKKDSQENITLSILFEKEGQSMDLNAFSKVIESYDKILRGSYLAASGKKSIQADKHDFSAKIVKFNNGSIIMDLIADYYPLIQTIVSAGIPHPLFSIVRQAYEFHKIKNKFIKENGKEPRINIINIINIGNNNINDVSIKNDTINTPKLVLKTANSTKKSWKSMVEAMSDGGIKSIHSKCGTANEDWQITESDIDAFSFDRWSNKQEDWSDKHEERIRAKIYKFDRKTGKGGLRVIELADFDSGIEFNFVVDKKAEDKKEVIYEKIINAMRGDVQATILTVTKDFRRYASGETKITLLRIKNIESLPPDNENLKNITKTRKGIEPESSSN